MSYNIVSSVWSSSLPDLTKVETAGIVVGVALSPLWSFTIGGVNLHFYDLVFLFVFASLTVRTGLFPFSQSRKTGIVIVVFLTIVGLSLLWSPNKIAGLLTFVQYLFILLGVVPIISHALRDRSLRWRVFLALWAVMTGITLFGLYTYISGDVSRFHDLAIWYGNQNQFYWLVASAFICSVALVLNDSLPFSVRFVSAVLAAIEAGMVVEGMSLSAILMIAGGMWLFTGFLAKRYSSRAIMAFMFATVLAGLAGFAVIVRYWHFFYIQASLYVRIPQYTTAIHLGIQYLPLGMGINGYGPTVHNFFLDYLVEVGIVGAGAVLALVIVWCRDVLLRSLRYSSRIDLFEFVFIAIFGTYVLVICFQPIPVHRYWWILFGASWAVAQDRLPSRPASP